jgi:hypothetical protein
MSVLAPADKGWTIVAVVLQALVVLAILIFVGYSCRNCNVKVPNYRPPGTAALSD